MSDEACPELEAAVERLVVQLLGLAFELGLNDAKVRRIVAQIATDMPLHTDEERLEWARKWMLAVSS
jgi:hypothetical protein